MAPKTYTGPELDVTFDADVCTHSGNCVRGLPEVFDLDRKPWILPGEASADRVRAAVARCPSGALQIVEK